MMRCKLSEIEPAKARKKVSTKDVFDGTKWRKVWQITNYGRNDGVTFENLSFEDCAPCKIISPFYAFLLFCALVRLGKL